jgi:hypothetical protein
MRIAVGDQVVVHEPGDWPPSGARVRWVAGMFAHEGCVALMCVVGRGWYWPATALADDEVPLEAVHRAARECAGQELEWARPIGVVAVQAPGASAPDDALLVFAGSLAGPPATPESPLIERVELVPPEDVVDRLSVLTGRVRARDTREIVNALVTAAEDELARGEVEPLFTEVRRHIFSRTTFFHCRVASRVDRSVTLLYRSSRASRVADADVPPGSTTVARCVEGADFVPWRVYGPDGDLLCSMAHIADGVHVEADRVTYRDLLVDVVVRGNGAPEVVDREDLDRALAEKRLTTADAARILRAGERIAQDPDAAFADLPEPD